MSIDAAGTFSPRMLIEGTTPGGRQLAGFEGRWLADEGLVIAAIAVPN